MRFAYSLLGQHVLIIVCGIHVLFNVIHFSPLLLFLPSLHTMLASSAEDIQLWDIHCPLQPEELNSLPLQPAKQWHPLVSGPNCTKITDLAWSHSANTISCAPGKFGGIVFCSVDQSVDGGRPQCKKEIVGHRCVDIGEKDRLLVTAGQDSNLYLYSMSRCKLWQVFKGHNGNVTAAVFNANSSHIASGSDKGEIILSNISTKESSAPLLAPRVQVINKLCYNPHKTSILGAVSSDGAVNIWDAGRAKLLQSANQVHTASATGLTFFTDNQQLLATVGLDGKLALFDTNNLSLVSITSIKSAITCMDVGGEVIALGTKQGAIYVYDYRNMKMPFIHKEAAHKSAVNCIKFRKLEEKLSLLNQSLGNLSQTSASGLKSSSKSTLEISDAGLELSPLRNNKIGFNLEENGLFSPESQHNSICHSDSSLDQSGISIAHFPDASLMWPSIKEPGILDMSIHRITNSVLLEQSSTNYGHFTDEEKLHCTSNMYTIQEQEVRKSPAMRLNIQDASLLQGGAENYKSLKSPQLPTPPSQTPDRLLTNNSSDSSGQKSVPISLKTLHAQDTAPLLSASDKYLPKSPSELSSKQNSSCSKPQTNFEKLPLSVESVPNPNVKTSQMQVYPSPTNANPLGNSSSGLSSSSSTVAPSNAFSFKLMHSVVQDAMEEFTDQIHNNFLCMQMNILHMFQRQQAELRYDLNQQLSIVNELVAENRQLKQENKQLRKNY